MPYSKSVDVLIAGGGLAGLTLALQLRLSLPDIRIMVLERRAHPLPDAAHKVGESTVEIGAHYFSEVIGLREHLQQQQLPKFGLRFFFRDDHQASLSSGLEVGGSDFFPVSTYQLDRGIFETHLAEQALENNIEFIDECVVRKIELGDQLGDQRDSHQIEFEKDSVRYQVNTSWVVDASGRAGLLKHKLGLAQDNDHNVNAIWFRIDDKIDLNEWCNDEHWHASGKQGQHRWLSTNHLMGSGYWVWLIPLASGSTSVGIVADPRYHPRASFDNFERALDWLHQHEPQCAAVIVERQHLLQDFLKLKHYSHSCPQVFSAQRWALTGDAGVFLDPFYSPGSDFIAIGNTYITDLICRQHQGESIAGLVPIYQKFFLSFFDNSMLLYQNQYPLFGNAQIMPVKIIWDYALYWSINAFLFVNNQFTNLNTLSQLQPELTKISEMNQRMQPLFLDWASRAKNTPVKTNLHHDKIPWLYELNERLLERMDGTAFIEQFRQHVDQLKMLSDEIIQQSQKTNKAAAPITEPAAMSQMSEVFDQLGL